MSLNLFILLSIISLVLVIYNALFIVIFRRIHNFKKELSAIVESVYSDHRRLTELILQHNLDEKAKRIKIFEDGLLKKSKLK